MPVFNPKTIISFLAYEKEEKVGFLWKKRSEQKKSYKKRYFILCGNILAYFEKKLDKDPLGIIFLDCHVVEMLDDVKMAIRFRGPGELSRCYILKAESAIEMEDWMRALSRASMEFINLTLEDVEDHYKALTAIKRTNITAVNSSGTHHIENNTSKTSLITSSNKSSVMLRRANPFNKTNFKQAITNNSITNATVTNTILTNTNTNAITSTNTTTSSSSSSLTNPTYISADEQNPLVNQHFQWLLSQNWEQLNDYLIDQFLTDSKTDSKDKK